MPVGWSRGMTCVAMGNPHVILYCRDVIEVPLATVGPRLERAADIPQADQRPFRPGPFAGEVTMRTWERGSGITLACGTGASAVCVAGVLTGRTVGASWPTCPAAIWNSSGPTDDHVYMTGPAVEVFSGEWPDQCR